jgi:molybdate transport system substrate-binding protein
MASFLLALFLSAAPVRVCAAASLEGVLPKVEGVTATYTFDASSKVAKQAKAGAPCDVVIVADAEWATWLEQEDKKSSGFALGERTAIAGNKLVWIVPESLINAAPRTLADVSRALPEKLAIGAESLPAGRYAEKALRVAGVFASLDKRIVRGDNVRIVLSWVSKREVPAGIVYLSDAISDPRVRVAFGIDAALHPPIIYSAFAITRPKKSALAAAEYVQALTSEAAKRAFVQAGFTAAP